MNCPLLGMLEIAVNKRDMLSNDLIGFFFYTSQILKGKKGTSISFIE